MGHANSPAFARQMRCEAECPAPYIAESMMIGRGHGKETQMQIASV
jgi:hypothetical protein